jgi:tetratricopeptide (TPR) repeat protein
LVSISGQDLKQQIKSLVPFCAYNLILGALVPHIDNAAHVGGLIAGLVLGAFAAYTARAAKGKRMVVCASTILLLATGALAGYRNRYVVLAERAQDCLEKGDLKCATWNAEKAVSANPEDPWSLVALGDVHFRSTKLDDAEAAYKRALVADSNFQYAMWMLGMVASKRERFEESYAYFLRLLPWSLTTQTSRITSGLHLAVS